VDILHSAEIMAPQMELSKIALVEITHSVAMVEPLAELSKIVLGEMALLTYNKL
jgi:hypothetical protein